MTITTPIDPRFRVEVISATPNPQQTVWTAMHQDYSDQFVYDHMDRWPSEEEAGERIVRLLLGGKGGKRHHWGPFEHPQIIFNCGWFPHSTMQQLRTHRTGVSFDVQSFRFTSSKLEWAARTFAIHSAKDENGDTLCNEIALEAVDKVCYFRQPGDYTDREGNRVTYTEGMRNEDLKLAGETLCHYFKRRQQGFPPEQARSGVLFDVRQHWVVSCNARTLCHLLDMRWKADAQLECQQWCDLVFLHFRAWMPALAEWYEENRMKKGIGAP